MNSLQWTSFGLGLAGEAALLLALIGGSGRHYVAMMVYCSFLLLSTLSDVAVILLIGPRSVGYFRYIWIAEFVRQACQLIFVITLVWQSLPQGRLRSALIRAIVGTTILLLLGSFAFYHAEPIWKGLAKVIRNVSFTAALINLVLWFTLVSSRHRDNRLLFISSGLGIQMTGDAIAQSLSQLSVRAPFPAIVSVGSFFLCLYIWWQAFRDRGPAPRDRDISTSNAANLSF